MDLRVDHYGNRK